MNALILHPINSTNLGDKIILEGTKSLLHEVFADLNETYIDLEVFEDWNSPIFQIADLCVISGTPWIWDKCHQSKKYQRLDHLLRALPKKTKKVALGIGSCFPWATNVLDVYVYQKDDNGVYEITRLHTREHLHKIFSSFDLVTTRDHLAFNILRKLDIHAFDCICPAAHIEIPQHFYKKESQEPLLVFLNPHDGVSHESCDKIFMDDFIQFEKWFKDKYSPDVITMDSLDRDWCLGQGWEKVEWVREIPRFLEIVSQSSFVISGRVHATIPARLLGKRAYILPWDTRYLTAVRLGAIPILTSSDLDWWMYDLGPQEDTLNKVKEVVTADRNFVLDKLRNL